jgi:tetratricopeptide (TPR) repeat protein
MRAALACGTVVLLAATAPAAASGSVDELVAAGKRATLRGDWDRALRELRAAQARAREERRGADEVRLGVEVARVVVERNFYHVLDRAGATAAAEKALAAAEAANDAAATAGARLQLARVTYTRAREDGSWERPTALAREALAGFAAAGDPAGFGNACFLLGTLEQMQERHLPAVPWFVRSLQAGLELGDLEMQANAQRHLGYLWRDRKELERSLPYFERSLAQREAAGATVNVPFALVTLAEVEAELGRRDAAVARLERAIAVAQASGSRRAEYQARLLLARWLLERGRTADAAAQATAARAAAERYGSEYGRKQADALLAETRR